ncbi:kinase-like protein, partial [Trifolium pratense]
GAAPLSVTFPRLYSISVQNTDGPRGGKQWPSSAEDIWVWGLEENGLFSVKSTYVSLSAEINIALPRGDFQGEVFEQIWKSPAPSKSITFEWQLLHDRSSVRSTSSFTVVSLP